RIVTLSYEAPGFSFAVLSEVVRASGGTMIKVDEDRAMARIGALARSEGRLIAPAAAVAVEGAARLIESGRIAADETVVVNLSGEGVVCHEVALP
ncbi:MAG: pyridoxal-phosphate dependent enzyme, partial [Myxococcales bacterium]|nr:pyridoxal-phosphate dependent enzyme [Myxococcales bacterium]